MLNKIKNTVSEYWKSFINTELPPSLARLRLSRLGMAIVVIFICILACIAMKTWSFMMGVVISLYLVFMAFSISYNYSHGNIYELHLKCIAFKVHRNQINVVFEDDNQQTYSLYYPNKKINIFEGVRYVVYVGKGDEKLIVAIQEE